MALGHIALYACVMMSHHSACNANMAGRDIVCVMPTGTPSLLQNESVLT